MAIRRRKSRIKLNDVMNEKLDSIRDDVSLDVFRPKIASEDVIMNLAYQAMEEENNMVGKGRKKNKVIATSSNKSLVISWLWLIILSFLFILFIVGIFKILY